MGFRPSSTRSGGLAIVAALLLALTPSPGAAAAEWSKFEGGRYFVNWQAQIAKMVGAGDKRSVNHVCIVGWRDKAGDNIQQAYIVWPEQHRLITWMPSTDPDSLSIETHVLDLRRDVVANERLINGSTYLVTRPWVANIERQCRLYGSELTFGRR